MSATHDPSVEPPPPRERAEAPASSLSPESYDRLASPSLRMAWLMRLGALVAVASAALGSIVLPGLRGFASDAEMTRWEHASGAIAYAMVFLLSGLLVTGAIDLARASRIGIVSRTMLFLGGPMVVAMLIPAFRQPLNVVPTFVLVGATTVVAVGGGLSGVRAPHTRALGAVQLVLACAAVTRLLAWSIGTGLGDSLRAYRVARTFGMTGIVFEGLAQMLMVAWLGTRRRMASSVMTAAALLGAFMTVVWLVHTDAASPPMQAMLKAGLSNQLMPGTPPALHALESFFIVASLYLACACALLRGQLAVVLCAMAFALVGRGAFDVPLRALAAAVGAFWTALAAVDDRAMWRSLTRD